MTSQKGDLYTARLTLDITPAMRARIKVSAFTQGVTVADLLRAPAGAGIPRTPRRHPHDMHTTLRRHGGARADICHCRELLRRNPPMASPLTRVALAYIDQRFDLYLRFGRARAHRPTRPLAALRGVHCRSPFFCRIRWQANDYGTIRWQLMVMQACTPLDARAAHPRRAAGRAPVAARRGRAQSVRAVLERIDAIEALGIDACYRLARVLGARWATVLLPGLLGRRPLPRIQRRAARRLRWPRGRCHEPLACSTAGTRRTRSRRRIGLHCCAGLSA